MVTSAAWVSRGAFEHHEVANGALMADSRAGYAALARPRPGTHSLSGRRRVDRPGPKQVAPARQLLGLLLSLLTADVCGG